VKAEERCEVGNSKCIAGVDILCRFDVSMTISVKCHITGNEMGDSTTSILTLSCMTLEKPKGFVLQHISF
jgi:hypothetical protein